MFKRTASSRYLANLGAHGLCLAVGIGTAVALSSWLAPILRWGDLKQPVSVEFQAQPEDGKLGDMPKLAAPEEVAESVARMPAEVNVPSVKTPEVVLPAPQDPNKPHNEVLAELSPREEPVIPETVGVYPEKRGGNVLVVQLTVDDSYTVVDAQIKVPSFDGLADLATVFGALGTKLKDVYPPIRQGERRIVDYRLRLIDPLEEAKEIVEETRRMELGLPEPVPFTPPEALLP